MSRLASRLDRAESAASRLPPPPDRPPVGPPSAAPPPDPWGPVADRLHAAGWPDPTADEAFASDAWPPEAERAAADAEVVRLCALFAVSAPDLFAWARRFLEDPAEGPGELPSPAALFPPLRRRENGPQAGRGLADALTQRVLRDGWDPAARRPRWRRGDPVAAGAYPVAYALHVAAAIGRVRPAWWPVPPTPSPSPCPA